MDIMRPTRLETFQKILPQDKFQVSDLPDALAPRFRTPSNQKLIGGNYRCASDSAQSVVYVYDFGEKNTTSAKKANHDTLELQTVNRQSLVEEKDIIPKLPPHTHYSKFTISRRGLGEKDHQDAIKSAVYKTAQLLKDCPAITDELLTQVVSKVTHKEMDDDDDDDESTFTVAVAHVVILHETVLNKMLFAKIVHFYPHLTIAVDSGGDGTFTYSRFSLSKEDIAVYGSLNGELEILSVVPEVDNIDGKSFEANLLSSKWQLIANMDKTASIVGMKAIRSRQLFKFITVIGLIVDYEKGCVVHLMKARLNYLTRETTLTEAPCSDNIDKMIARIDAYFKT